jgi:hypothetical protein
VIDLHYLKQFINYTLDPSNPGWISSMTGGEWWKFAQSAAELGRGRPDEMR